MARGDGVAEAAVEDARPVEVTARGLDPTPLRRFPLNSQDRFLLVEDEMLRGRGWPGIQCQSHVWWEGRVDEEELRRAVLRLGTSHPAATARLVRMPSISDVHWEERPGEPIPFQVVHLDDDSDEAVLRFTGDTLHTPIDLARDAPLSFVLVRRPTAGDVLCVPYSHVLMDGKAPESMLLEMNRGAEPSPDGDERQNEVAAWLRGYSTPRRVFAMNRLMWTVVFSRARAERVLTIPQPPGPWRVGTGIRVHLRSLDPDATDRFRRRVRQSIGIESLAPALVASAFRAVAALHPPAERGICRTYVPVSLRATRGLKVPIFCNLSSILRLSARREALTSRDALVRELHGRMRKQIRAGRDMAVAQASWWLMYKRRALAWRFVLRNRTWDTSFVFGYHGAASPELTTLLGAPVRRLYNVLSVANPPGVSLSIYQAAGSLHAAVTRVDGVVPGDLTERFLDDFVADLVA